MNKIKILLLLVLIPGTSIAEQKIYCANLESIANNIESCEDNDLLAVAALKCLRKLQSDIQSAGIILDAGLKAQNAMHTNAQAKDIQSSAKSYNISKNALDALITQAEQQAEEVSAYAQNLVAPEDFDAPWMENKREYLEQSECFKDNAEAIMYMLDDFDSSIENLYAARKIANTNEGISNTDDTKIKVNSSANSSAAGASKKTPKLDRKDTNNDSTITGETDKEKAAKKPKN